MDASPAVAPTGSSQISVWLPLSLNFFLASYQPSQLSMVGS